ncbi:hypothetical protein HHK36_011691 [Tetracentron sinense]|uniref:Uncharacterized protein n=1 Tax=Tetracentron sinense TaxID=13715 RepID=A0A834ZBJ0_TETSI|nr:hypothetical protein HHK36_011691 [Tetracentron sinense]
MAISRKLSIFMLCVLMMLTVLVEYQATSTEIPASHAQAASNSHMYGVTQGSLHPQGESTVHRAAPLDAQRQLTRSHACSSAKSVAPSACVCLRAHTETSSLALATITGRPRGEDPNALNYST